MKTVYEKINKAFDSAVYPGDKNIGDQPPGVCLETDAIVEFFHGKQWQDITLEELQEGYKGDASACLAFMTPEAYRFYVPAYMLIALSNYNEADVTADTAINSFIPPDESSADMYQWWEQRVGGFPPEQRETIIAFLEYMQGAHAEDYPVHSPAEALTKLKKYWVKS